MPVVISEIKSNKTLNAVILQQSLCYTLFVETVSLSWTDDLLSFGSELLETPGLLTLRFV